MLPPPRSEVGKRLRQVQTHMGLQLQPYRPLVLGSRFHLPLLPCPRNQINSGATRSAPWQIAAAVLSLLPHSTSTTRTINTFLCTSIPAIFIASFGLKGGAR